ncbi:MAG TPA: hypothetical protein VGI04_12300 [Neobacillus sp.]
MEKNQANTLANFIGKTKSSIYQIKKLETVGGTLPKFHQWTNGKKTLAGYEVTKVDSDTSYFFLFIDWHRNDNYYLVIYAHDRSTTVAEIQQIKELEGIPHFVWMYKPFKRDGKNDQRKAFFKQMFGSTTVEIKLPSSSLEVDDFFSQAFKLCQNRIKADRIVDVFEI